MVSLGNEIYMIPYEEKFLFHAPLHGVTSLINGRMALEVQHCLSLGRLNGASPAAFALVKPVLRKFVTEPPVSEGAFSPKQVSILPTNDCNMRCLYCGPEAGDAGSGYMSTDICDVALRFQASIVHREHLASLMVYYFGGEPFFAWDLVNFCDQTGHDLANNLGVPFRSACTTNAYMSTEQAKWVAKHLNFALVSLDGPAELHNFYRPNRKGGTTHDVVVRNIKIFEEYGLLYALRCSVDDRVVHRVPEIVEYFCTNFKPQKINLEPLIEHGRCTETGLKSPKPEDFVHAVVEAGKVVREFGVELKLTTAQAERLAQSYCSIVEDNFVVTPDGLITACYAANNRNSKYIAEYAFGEVDVGMHQVKIDQNRLDKIRSYGVSNIPRCRSCFCKWHCSGGCHLFHTATHNSEKPNEICLITQKLTLWRILTNLQLFDEADRVSITSEELLNVQV